jgi:hypothetical protein
MGEATVSEALEVVFRSFWTWLGTWMIVASFGPLVATTAAAKAADAARKAKEERKP